MIQGWIAKIVQFHQEYGTRKLIRTSLLRLKNTIFFYQKEVVGCVSLTNPVPCVSLPIAITVRAAKFSDIPELKKLTATYKKRDFHKWINDRYIFFVAELNTPTAESNTSTIPKDSKVNASTLFNAIIGYGCVCPAKHYNNKLVSILKLQDTDYWAVDVYIHPAYRGKGVNSAIASGFLTQAKREGFKRGYGTILFNNSASRKSYAMIGEKEIGIFTTIKIMGITIRYLKKYRGYEEFFN